MNEGDVLSLIEHKYEQKFTKPPTRYTEASLVKLMEEKGIGRPATYVPTVTLLGTRHYIEKDGKYLVPTKLGEEVTDMLVRYFPDIMDVKFTANMEEKLDDIEYGGKVWQNVVGEFYDGFEDKIAAANGDSFSLKAADEVSNVKCDKCGAFMVIRNGKFGKFLACPNYPKCKNTKPIEVLTGGEAKPQTDGDSFSLRPSSGSVAPEEKSTPEATGEVCEKCGRPMVLRKGRYGNFLACSGYPECKNIRNLTGTKSETDGDYGKCPKCG